MNRERPVADGRAVMLLVVLWLPCANRSFAEIEPPRGTVDSRIRTVAYDGRQVYRIRGYVGYQIDLQFEAGESFVGLGAGDIEGLSYFGQDNHLFLKPKAPRVATNLTVLTNRRHYQFDYAVRSSHPVAGDPEVVFALQFTYPVTPGQAAAGASAAQIESELGSAAARRRQNYDYWYCGAPVLQPVFAADDGVHTRLRFAANADLPAVFVRNEDGDEALLNFSMEGGDLVLHRVARRFVFRRGTLTGCLVNKGYRGGGIRLDSGTVAPDVERRVPGRMP